MSEKFFKVKSGITTANIVFNNKTVNSNLQVSYLQSNVLSFSGTSGQLFSIADTMTGTIFAVNDISGVPSIEVYDTGDIRLAETFGNVLIGSNTNTTSSKLEVNNGKFAISNGGVFELPNTSIVTSYATDPADSTNRVFAIRAYPTLSYNPTAITNGDSLTASQFSAVYKPTANLTTGTLYGYGMTGILSTDVTSVGGFQNHDLRGIYGNMYHYHNSDLLRMVGIAGRTYNRGNGTVGTAYSVWARNSTKTSGNITASYGLFVDDITGGISNYGIASAVSNGSNKWSMYVSGNADSYYAGNIGLGITTPTEKLDVAGNIKVSGGIKASNSYGSPGQVLTSNSSGVYWSTVTASSGLGASSYVVRAVKNGSTQTVTSGADAVVTLVDDFDPQGWWTPDKFQPTIAGYYTISAQLWWGAGTINNNQTNLQLRKNGSVQLAIAQTPVNSSTVGEFLSINTIAYFNGTTDYVEVTAYTANPTSQLINGSASGTWFAAALLASGWNESSINNVQSNVATVSSNLNALTTSVGTISSNVNTITTNLGTVSSNLNALTTSVTTISGNVNTVTTNLGTVSSNLNTVSSNVSNILTGTTSFTGSKTFAGPVVLNNTLSANASVGSAGQILTSNGSGVYWSTPSSGGITTGKAIAMAIVFGG